MRRTRNAIFSMLVSAVDAVAAFRLAPFDPLGFNPRGLGLYGAEAGADTTQGGGGADTTGGGEQDDPPPVPMVPKSEATAAFQARDAAKKALKATVALLGYDPQHTKVVETGDADNPWRVELDGEDITEEFKGKKRPAKSQTGDELKAAEAKYKSRLAAVGAEYSKREAGLIRIIDQLAVLTPLRAACAANDALDSGGQAGEYADVVELARKSLRTEVSRDDEGQIVLDDAGNPTITVTPMNADGTPMVETTTGKPVAIGEFVKRFLDKRPAFKRNKRPGGPGAGGNGHGLPGGRPGNLASGAKAAGFGLFGMAAPGQNNG
jgi:hypothetical protein